MGVLKRIITNIIRRPAQTMIMFFIILVLGSVLFASLAIQNASGVIKDHIRESMLTQVDVRMDNNINLYKTNDYLKMDQIFRQLKQDERVLKMKQSMILHDMHLYSRIDEDTKELVTWNGNMSFVASDFDEVNESDISMSNGSWFSEEQLHSDIPYVIIPADYNIYTSQDVSGSIPETIEFTIPDYTFLNFEGIEIPIIQKIPSDKKITFKVIGIYRANYNNVKYEALYDELIIPQKWQQEIEKMAQEVIDSHSEEENQLYADITQIDVSDLSFDLLGMMPLRYQIYTKGIDQMEEIEEMIKNHKDYQGLYYTLQSSASDYKYIQAPVENITALANVACGVTFVLMVVMLSLVSMLFLKTRKEEIGILVALGERKMKIVLQLVFEIVLVGMLATGFSLISGNQLGSLISKEFMSIQIDFEQEQQIKEDDPDKMTQIDVLDAYEIEMSLEYILAVAGTSLIILLISSSFVVLYTIRVNPKKIMME